MTNFNIETHLSKILRVVKDHDWNNNPVTRESIGGEEEYIKLLIKVYNYSPIYIKEMFKKLTRIYIESNMKLGACAQLYRERPGATLGLKKLDIDKAKALEKLFQEKSS